MFLLVTAALAATPQQQIVYELVMNGEKIGTREVTLRWIPREKGERRIIETYTSLTAAGTPFACRSSGTTSGGSAQFTSSVQQGEAVYQVQGMEMPGGGWRVIVDEGKGPAEKTVDARLSTLDLFDPARARALEAPGPMGLVVVESGDLLSGTLGEGVEGTIKIGGEKVPVTRYTVDGAAGKARFDLDGSGTLLRSEVSWLGGTVIATAQSLPPPRSYGEIEKIESIGGAVEETPL